MSLCRMNILGLYTVLCLMTIYGVDVCGAECDEYFIVFKERICPNTYSLTPLKSDQIKIIWDKVNYPCNSTDKALGKKCLVEFNCFRSNTLCNKHIIPTNFQNHSFIADDHSAKLVINTTESVLVPTTTENNAAAPVVTTAAGLVPTTTDNNTAAPVVTTEAGLVPTTTHNNKATTHVTTREALYVPKNNINGEEKPRHTVHADYNPTTYDVNITYINDKNIQNSLEKSNEPAKHRNKILQCEYAEIVCVDDGITESHSLSHHYKPPETLKIEINRDETSAVQPLFTGYFPESSNDSSTNYNDNFSHQKAMLTSCSIKKASNCKGNIKSLKHINLYLKTNYIENNTLTMYPDCTKESHTSEDKLIVKCEDISFAKHNPHIIQAPPKKELWYCQIAEYKNTLPSSEQRSENSKIHFFNCSNETKPVNYKNKPEDINVAPISETKTISAKKVTYMNVSSQTNPKNIITIRIAEESTNCSHKSSISFNEGKIIDLGLNNNTVKILQNNKVDLILSNCMNDHFSIINNKEPLPNTELTIILKNESLNTSNLEQFNGTVKDENVKQRILLRCDHANLNLNSNTTSNQTELQCESIDLDLYNITGMEITPSSQIINKEVNKSISRQEPSWSCLISEKQQKNKLHFENCSNDVNINYSKNELVKNNILPVSNGENRNITIIKPKNDININNTEITSGKLEQNKNKLSKSNHMIAIFISEKANNCSSNSSLNVDKGKIVNFGENDNKVEILQNNNIQLELSNCINVNSSIINETQADSKMDLTILLKSEAINASDLEQFNGTLKEGNVKQRILLRCDHPTINTTSNMTVLQCESIDLDLYNITGIEISEKLIPSSNVSNSKETKKNLNNDKEIDNTIEINKNSNFSTNQTVESSTAYNKSNESKEVQKNLPESEEIFNQNFNRRKDIPNGTGQRSLAIKSAETEKILLIALLSIACSAILIVIVLRICTKEKEYNLAPTREPANEEETAF